MDMNKLPFRFPGAMCALSPNVTSKPKKYYSKNAKQTPLVERYNFGPRQLSDKNENSA